MRPSLSLWLRPSFEQYYDSYIGANDELELYIGSRAPLNGAPVSNPIQFLEFSLWAKPVRPRCVTKILLQLNLKKISLFEAP